MSIPNVRVGGAAMVRRSIRDRAAPKIYIVYNPVDRIGVRFSNGCL